MASYLAMSDSAQAKQGGTSKSSAHAALLIVDMINNLNFPDNEELVRQSNALGFAVQHLKARCSEAGIPSIYINDNMGRWRSDFAEAVRQCLLPSSAGRDMVQHIKP